MRAEERLLVIIMLVHVLVYVLLHHRMTEEKSAFLSGSSCNNDIWIVITVCVGLQTHGNSALCCQHAHMFLVMSCYLTTVSIESLFLVCLYACLHLITYHMDHKRIFMIRKGFILRRYHSVKIIKPPMIGRRVNNKF
jgi:hypothetical protein